MSYLLYAAGYPHELQQESAGVYQTCWKVSGTPGACLPGDDAVSPVVAWCAVVGGPDSVVLDSSGLVLALGSSHGGNRPVCSTQSTLRILTSSGLPCLAPEKVHCTKPFN